MGPDQLESNSPSASLLNKLALFSMCDTQNALCRFWIEVLELNPLASGYEEIFETNPKGIGQSRSS